jgi:environmental stress-induced protein Ves
MGGPPVYLGRLAIVCLSSSHLEGSVEWQQFQQRTFARMILWQSQAMTCRGSRRRADSSRESKRPRVYMLPTQACANGREMSARFVRESPAPLGLLASRGTVPAMIWSLTRLSEAPALPWRNGGGVTHELAIGPTRDEWAWRISVADVAADGPFSDFAGVQRWFAVVRGAGVRLTVDGQVHEVVATGAPLEFDGAAQVESRLLSGPTQDLNLMMQRTRATGRMVRVAGTRCFDLAADGVIAVYALDAGATLNTSSRAEPVDMPPHSLAWATMPAGTEVEVTSSGALCMEITLRG